MFIPWRAFIAVMTTVVNLGRKCVGSPGIDSRSRMKKCVKKNQTTHMACRSHFLLCKPQQETNKYADDTSGENEWMECRNIKSVWKAASPTGRSYHSHDNDKYEKNLNHFVLIVFTCIILIIIINTGTHTWSMMESRVLSSRKPRPLTRYSPSATMWLSSSSSSRASALWATALHSWWTSVRNSLAKVLLAPLMSELQENGGHQGAAAQSPKSTRAFFVLGL